MSRIRSHLTFANVASAIALFVARSGGTAVALNGSNTVFSDDITDNQVFSADVRNDTLSGGGLAAADLRPSSVGTSEVANGSLNDEDVGQGTFVNFTGAIGTVAANSCTVKLVTGVNAQGDHLLLTPNADTEDHDLVYQAEYRSSAESMFIQACNPKNFPIDDGNTNFNLLVIDAQ
jgi:hypothetical protein